METSEYLNFCFYGTCSQFVVI